MTAKEVDINDEYQIASIKSVIYDQEEKFYYILSNKFEEKLGFFVIKVSEKDPSDKRFLIKWKNKLDIGDPNMFILRNYESKLKELSSSSDEKQKMYDALKQDFDWKITQMTSKAEQQGVATK